MFHTKWLNDFESGQIGLVSLWSIDVVGKALLDKNHFICTNTYTFIYLPYPKIKNLE